MVISKDAQKVLFVISDLKPGGAQKVLMLVANHLASMGRKIVVVTYSEPHTDFYSLSDNVERQTTRGLMPSIGILQAAFANFRRIKALRSLVMKTKPDAVFSFMVETNILTILSTLGLPIRVIVSERSDPLIDPISPIWSFLRKITYRLSDEVTANSTGALDYLKRFVKVSKLVYLPNPVMNIKKEIQEHEGNIILFVGRLSKQKGVDLLIRALAELRIQGRDYTLWVVGDGPERIVLEELSKSLGVDDCIIWYGFRNEVNEYYKNASIFVLPSRYEGTSNAMLEAMSAGLPVIVSDASSGLLDYVKNGITGAVIKSESTQDLACAIDKLMLDSALREKLVEGAYRILYPCMIDNAIHDWEDILYAQ